MAEQLEQKYLKYYLPCPQTQIYTNQELQDYNQESQKSSRTITFTLKEQKLQTTKLELV